MKSPTLKYLTAYIFRFIIDTAFVLCLISGIRLLITNRAINKAANQINQNAPEIAIENLKDATLWSPAYPSQARRIDYLMINAGHMQNDQNIVRKYSKTISSHSMRTLADAHSYWEKAIVYPDILINLILKKYAPENWDVTQAQIQSLPTLRHTQNPAGKFQTAPRPKERPNKSLKPTNQTPDTSPQLPDMPDMPKMPDTPIAKQDSQQDLPDTTEWGFTTDYKTAIYSMSGKLLGHISAGNMLEVHEHKKTKKGELLICTIIMNNKKYPKTIIRREDTIIYNNNLSETTEAQRKLAARHAVLLGEISKRESQLKKAAADRNPYTKQYKRALAKYKETAKKNNALLKAYNDASGSRRMELADKLRLSKDSSEETVKKYTAAKQQYTNWKSQNTSANIDLENDSKIHKLRNQVSAIEKQLANP